MTSTSGYCSSLHKSFKWGDVFIAGLDSEYELCNSNCDDKHNDLWIWTGTDQILSDQDDNSW